MAVRNLTYKLTFIYLFFSVFEFYINATIGNVTRFFMLFYCLVCFFETLSSGKLRKVSYCQFSVLLWLVYSLITICWSTNITQVKVYIFTFVTMSFLWFCVLANDYTHDQIDSLLSFFQVCSLVLCILGLFFSAPLLEDGTNNIRYVLYINGSRADPNYLLALYVINVQIGLYRLLNYEKNRIFNIVSVLLGCVAILYTGSRSGILILGVSFLVIGWNKLKNISFAKKIGLLVGVIIGLVVLYYIASRFIPEATLNRVLGIGDLKYTNSTGRIESWTRRFEAWKGFNNIFFGMGFGSNTAHSTLLSFILEFGILGFSLYLYPVCCVLIQNIKTKNSLAIALMLGGLIQAFMCPATNMRFFWNAMIIPSLLINKMSNSVNDTDNSTGV